MTSTKLRVSVSCVCDQMIKSSNHELIGLHTSTDSWAADSSQPQRPCLFVQASPSDPDNFPFVVLGNKADGDVGKSRAVSNSP